MSDASSETLPAASVPLNSSLSREGSLYMKRGASIAALSLTDPTAASKDVQPASSSTASNDEAASSNSAEKVVAEGGPLVDAMDDFKAQNWTAPAQQ